MQHQIVTESGDFDPELRQSLVSEAVSSYSVVSILGPQSSGKSTLLNALFDCEFPVLDPSAGRTWTTRGVWIWSDQRSDVLIMDMEGTDARARGEQVVYEKRFALFSLALSEVLIVNMWAHDIGRYHASNDFLLQTVMEVHLQLFGGSLAGTRTVLVFVVHDHTGDTSCGVLRQQLTHNFDSIWSGLSGSSGPYTEHFDLQFCFLPHRQFAQEQWQADVAALRSRFQPGAPGCLIPERRTKAVPADGFVEYARGVWSAIVANQDLNLPQQREVLARFRCESMKKSLFADFEAKMDEIGEELSGSGILPDLRSRIDTVGDSLLEKYDAFSTHYESSIAAEIRKSLVSEFISSAVRLVERNLGLILERTQTRFDARVGADCTPVEGSVGSFLSQCQLLPVTLEGLQEGFVSEFQQEMRDCVPSWIVLSSDSVERLSSWIAERSETLLQKWRLSLDKCLKSVVETRLRHLVVARVTRIHGDVWADIWEVCSGEMSELLDDARPAWSSLYHMARTAELASKCYTFFVLDVLVPAARNASEVIDERMQSVFSDCFWVDSEGLPRNWAGTRSINSVFAQASAAGRNVCLSLSNVPISSEVTEFVPDLGERNDEAETCQQYPRIIQILPEESVRTKIAHFTADRMRDYESAVRLQSSAVSTIPLYIWLIMAVLGWNELVYVIRYPILLLVAIAAAGMAYYVKREGGVKTFAKRQIARILKRNSGVTQSDSDGNSNGSPN